MGTLTAKDVENLLENHPWPYEAYEETRYVRSDGGYYGGKYEKTGKILPKGFSTIAMGDDAGRNRVDWFAWEDCDPQYVNGLGLVSLESQHGGEGEGDRYYIILQVVMEAGLQDDGMVRYFRKNGWHASHDGSYLDGSFDEVAPKQKTITVWE